MIKRISWSRVVTFGVACLGLLNLTGQDLTPKVEKLEKGKQPRANYELWKSKRMILTGKVAKAEKHDTGPLAGIDVQEGCGFELLLKPEYGPKAAVEVRMTKKPWKKSADECEAEFDVGIPEILQFSDELVKQAEGGGEPLRTTEPPPDIQVGPGNGKGKNAPDLDFLFEKKAKKDSASAFAGEAAPQAAVFTGGVMSGYVTDPPPFMWNMTLLNQYIGWQYDYVNCIQPAGYSRYFGVRWESGWVAAYDTYSQFYGCNATGQVEYAMGMNTAFCSPVYYPGQAPVVYVQHWPQEVQGFQNGQLYGHFHWTIGGAACSALLTPRYVLSRWY
jgi:hypothetical protein